jgi:hypothetical protein
VNWLLGADFPKTEDGTMVGNAIPPSAYADVFLMNVLRVFFPVFMIMGTYCFDTSCAVW